MENKGEGKEVEWAEDIMERLLDTWEYNLEMKVLEQSTVETFEQVHAYSKTSIDSTSRKIINIYLM